MRVMFCNFNMFDINAQVVAMQEDAGSWPLFAGNFDDVCEFMAAEYQTDKYDKIVLSGAYAEAVEERVRAYSRVNYNFEEMNIEVID